MPKYRQGRINDEFQKEIALILRDVKDPRVSGAFISVTGAEVTPDLKYAKVYYSSLMGDKKEVKRGLIIAVKGDLLGQYCAVCRADHYNETAIGDHRDRQLIR